MSHVTMLRRTRALAAVVLAALHFTPNPASAQALPGVWGSSLYRAEFSVSGTTISGTFTSVINQKDPAGTIAGQLQKDGRTFVADWSAPVGNETAVFKTWLTLGGREDQLVGYRWNEDGEPTAFALHRAVDGAIPEPILDENPPAALGPPRSPEAGQADAGPPATAAPAQPPAAAGSPAPALPPQPKAPGYWKFVEKVWVEPPAEKRHPVYPVVLTPNGNQVSAVCRVIDLSRGSRVDVEEHHTWTWTPPPAILVPGERFPMRIELDAKLVFSRVGPYEYGARFDAGFGPSMPMTSGQYDSGGDTQVPGGGRGTLQRGGEFGVHGQGHFTKDSFVLVPRKGAYEDPKRPGRISFRAGGVYSFGWNTRYEYVWVDGEPPADRGTTEKAGSPGRAPVVSPQGSTRDASGASPGTRSGSNQAATASGGGAQSGRAGSVLRLITTKWAGSQANYAKADQDLVFEVGMGSSPRFGYGYAGVELQNVRGISAEVLSAPARYAHYDANSFAGFVIQYATPIGNGKRVMLGTGMLDRKRGDIMFLDAAGVFAPPTTEFVDVGVHPSYDFDLGRWAPPNWTGKVVLVIGLQNAGENSVLKVRLKPR